MAGDDVKMSSGEMSGEKQEFGTDVSRLLDIVANALYTNRDIFLRELISNSADACDRLRYEAVRNPDLGVDTSGLCIRVIKAPKKRTLAILDNGIGMNGEELSENLGTIARSGTAAIMEGIKDSANSEGNLNLIGQFGVGFYSCFMVCDRAEVLSRKAGDDVAYYWESDGKSGFVVRTASDEECTSLPYDCGTCVILHLKDDASDYLLEEKLKQVILTYSDHVDVPIFVEDEKDGEKERSESEAGEEKKPVNAASALWTRPKSEISEDQYKEFYHHIGHVFDDPLLTCHWKAEGRMEYTALLFVPAMRPWDLFSPERRHSVRLYVKRVFITDNVEGLVYPWLRFVRGVIDSQDLPLNISREMLQRNPIIEKIRRGVTKRILSELYKLSQDDEASFNTFWHQFGAVLKEGLYDAYEHREEIFKICRFYSTHGDENGVSVLVSLDGYISRMKEGQSEIYYMSGENVDTMRNSPQIEGFVSRGIEVLFFTDTVDDFWLQMVSDYHGKRFKSVTKGDVDLSSFDKVGKDGESEEESKDKGGSSDKDDKGKEESIRKLIDVLNEELAGEVEKVRLSSRLISSPVCLVASDSGVDMKMESVLKIQQKYDPVSKKVLEINENHSLIKRLAGLVEKDGSSADLKDAAWLLLDQAKIIQGESISNPSEFARRMAAFMERSLVA